MATEAKRPPGLRWIRGVPYWVAKDKGYLPRTVNLGHLRDDPQRLSDRCHRLNAEMMSERSDTIGRTAVYDGTFASLFRLYQTDPRSRFKKLKPGVRRNYCNYLPVLERDLGAMRVRNLNGLDFQEFYRQWRTGADGRDMLPRAAFIVAVLRAALTYGSSAGHGECAALKGMLRDMRFEKPRRRTTVVTAAMVDAIRTAAHEAGRPSVALASALQFETLARQFDVIGRWLPLDYAVMSDVATPSGKWVGPTWADIKDGILKYTPSKTELSSGVEVEVDLTLCPMVMDELARVPVDKRAGPLIVNERTGQPYHHEAFRKEWRALARTCGLPDTVWSRDIRAGGVTEGRKAGASTDDLAKTAGHTDGRTTARVYDRDVLEAQRRAATSRAAFRKK